MTQAIGFCGRHSLKQADQDFERRLAQCQAREDKLTGQLKQAELERAAASAEVQAVRESLKESQTAVETTRRLLEQQSEDHGKVLRVLNLELLEAHERSNLSKQLQKQHEERVEKLQKQVSDLMAARQSQQVEQALKHLGTPSMQASYSADAPGERDDAKLPRRSSNLPREAASEDGLSGHLVADDLVSSPYDLAPLDGTRLRVTGEPVVGDAMQEASQESALQRKGVDEKQDGGLNSSTAFDRVQSASVTAASQIALADARPKATKSVIKAAAEAMKLDGSASSVQSARLTSKASAQDIQLLQKHLSELRGELANYKDAARRLEQENHLLKQPRAIVSPSIKRNFAGSHVPRQAPSAAQQTYPNASPSRVGAVESHACIAASLSSWPDESVLSCGEQQMVSRAAGSMSDSAATQRSDPAISITKAKRTIPAFKKVEAAAAAAAAAREAAYKTTPCKPRPPRFVPVPHPPPQPPSKPNPGKGLEARPPWMGASCWLPFALDV